MTDVNPYIWTHYTLDHLGLSLDIFADQSFLTVRRDGALTTLIQDQGVVRLIVWAGPGQTLESWRERLNVRNEAHFEEEEEAMICGKAARRQTATLTEGGAVGAFTDAQGVVGHMYQQVSTWVHACVSFSHAGQQVLVCWVVNEDAHAARAADERRFLASVRCRSR